MARRKKLSDAVAAASANAPQDIPPGPAIDRDDLMPGYRERHDGWTRERVQRFFDVLGYTGCVKDAARVAGMSDVAARRAQEKHPRFAKAWAEALARSQQGLIAIAYRRAVEGRETIIIRKGEEHERRIQPSDAILRMLVNRGDMMGAGGAAEDPDTRITWDEWQQGLRFDDDGSKFNDEAATAGLYWTDAKLRQMRSRMEHGPDATCSRCNQPWPTRRAEALPGEVPVAV